MKELCMWSVAILGMASLLWGIRAIETDLGERPLLQLLSLVCGLVAMYIFAYVIVWNVQ
jgi:hypothetical protein